MYNNALKCLAPKQCNDFTKPQELDWLKITGFKIHGAGIQLQTTGKSVQSKSAFTAQILKIEHSVMWFSCSPHVHAWDSVNCE